MRRHSSRRMRDFEPEVVFHLAAQPLVRESYVDPVGTYMTNVIGTANVLEAVRQTPLGASGRRRYHRQMLSEQRVGLGLPRSRPFGRPRSLQRQ